MVVGLAVTVAACQRSVGVVGVFIRTLASVAVAHRGTDVIAVAVVVGVVRVVVVVVVVDGLGAVMMVRMIPGTAARVMRTVPAPAVAETVVIPVGRIVVGTVVVARPPPVVTQVNA